MGRGIADSAVVSPGEMIAMADYDPSYDDDGDGDHPDTLFSYCLTGNHHRGRANVVFCDAHVEYAKTNAWAAPVTFSAAPACITSGSHALEQRPSNPQRSCLVPLK